MNPDSRVGRASDDERQDAAERLRRAQGEGRITLDEYDSRLQRAYRAVSYGDLLDLFADLPNHAPILPPPPPPVVLPPPQPVYRNRDRARGSLVMAIVSLLACWVPLVNLVLSGTAMGLSVHSIRRAHQPGHGGHSTAVISLVLSSVALALAILIMIAVVVR
jgi:hypothetical protein